MIREVLTVGSLDQILKVTGNQITRGKEEDQVTDQDKVLHDKIDPTLTRARKDHLCLKPRKTARLPQMKAQQNQRQNEDQEVNQKLMMMVF